jgi:hypothetical protein
MGAVAAVMGVLIGVSGSSKSQALLGEPPRPLSLRVSLVVGFVWGLIVFLLYKADRWPYPDIWGRKANEDAPLAARKIGEQGGSSSHRCCGRLRRLLRHH